ncbi:MAG: hypothetical protein ABIU09_01805 [Pyrinomonadaceae bacterium]
MELRDEIENDLALAMLIEKRHALKVGSKEARDLIEKIKSALKAENVETAADTPPQDLGAHFPFH